MIKNYRFLFFLQMWFYYDLVSSLLNNDNYQNSYPSTYGYQNYNQLSYRPQVSLYYESKCPQCGTFVSQDFVKVVRLLGPYLDIRTYPYGNAKTTLNANGRLDFECQHGLDECYGNKLHACAIDTIRDYHRSLIFNGCMLSAGHQGYTNDMAADVCGVKMNIDAEGVKSCAKSFRGSQLLKYYGEKTENVQLKYVPHLLINGVQWKSDEGISLMSSVCAAFTNPPKQCRMY